MNIQKYDFIICFSDIIKNGHYIDIYNIFNKLKKNKILNIDMDGTYKNSDIILKIYNLNINIINKNSIIYNIYIYNNNLYKSIDDYIHKDLFLNYKYSPFSFIFYYNKKFNYDKFKDINNIDNDSIWIIKENHSYGAIGIKILKYKDLYNYNFDNKTYVI